jgi:TonB family protein
VSGVVESLPLLRQGLGTESDPGAALEMARALLGLGGPGDDPAILEAAHRIPATQLAVVLAWTRKQVGVAALPGFLNLKLRNHRAVLTIVGNLVSKDAKALDQVARVVLESSDESWWDAVLTVAEYQPVALDPARLEAAFRSTSRDVRDCTWWYVAVLGAQGKSLPRLASSPRDPDGEATPATPEALFGRELAARALKLPPVEQPAFEARARSGADLAIPTFARSSLKDTANVLLTKSERETLGMPAGVTAVNAPSQALEPEPPGKYGAMHTVIDVPDGYVTDVLKQTGCPHPNSEDIGGAVVRFDGNKLTELRWIATSLSPPCVTAARYITAASLVPTWALAPGKRELVALPMHQSFIECLSHAEPQEPVDDAAFHVGSGHIKPPKETRHINPVYPPDAIKEKRQGAVVLELTISPSGCVRYAKVVRSVAADIDVAALRAVTDWAYTPLLSNGVPEGLLMTVTVQFSLQ